MLNAWHHIDSTKEVQLLDGILDVCVNQKGVDFAVDVLDCNLEAVETPCFGHSYLGGKVSAKIFVDNAIGSSEEGEDMGYEVSISVL